MTTPEQRAEWARLAAQGIPGLSWENVGMIRQLRGVIHALLAEVERLEEERVWREDHAKDVCMALDKIGVPQTNDERAVDRVHNRIALLGEVHAEVAALRALVKDAVPLFVWALNGTPCEPWKEDINKWIRRQVESSLDITPSAEPGKVDIVESSTGLHPDCAPNGCYMFPPASIEREMCQRQCRLITPLSPGVRKAMARFHQRLAEVMDFTSNPVALTPKAENAEFIAHASRDVSALIAEVRRLRVALDAIARAHLDTGACAENCKSWNDYDDCDCGYVEASDDVGAFAHDTLAFVSSAP